MRTQTDEVEGDSPDREHYFEFDISPEVRRGVYANILNIWFTPYEFAFDWGLAEQFEPDDPNPDTDPDLDSRARPASDRSRI